MSVFSGGTVSDTKGEATRDDAGGAIMGGVPGGIPGTLGAGGVMVGGAVVGADGQTIVNPGLDAKQKAEFT